MEEFLSELYAIYCGQDRDTTAPGIQVARVQNGSYYAAVHRYPERASVRVIICNDYGRTVKEALARLYENWRIYEPRAQRYSTDIRAAGRPDLRRQEILGTWDDPGSRNFVRKSTRQRIERNQGYPPSALKPTPPTAGRMTPELVSTPAFVSTPAKKAEPAKATEKKQEEPVDRFKLIEID